MYFLRLALTKASQPTRALLSHHSQPQSTLFKNKKMNKITIMHVKKFVPGFVKQIPSLEVYQTELAQKSISLAYKHKKSPCTWRYQTGPKFMSGASNRH
jgi:hypothetical protein